MGARPRAPRDRDRTDRWVVLAASVCVAAPAAVAAVRAVRWGWVPVSDQATISLRSADVLTGRSPRLGQLSGATAEVGLTTRSPGPMGYWPFAATARWGPLWGSVVVAALVSGGAMVGSVRLAARRGGPALAVAVALGLALTARAINPANLVSTWNPAVGVMPLVLLVLLSWSIGVGEIGLLPVAVLVGSFCAQAHAALGVAAAPVLLIGATAGLVPAVRSSAGAVGRTVLLAAAVGAGCWALPLGEQVTGDPGNLTRLARAGPEHPVAGEVVARVVVDAVGAVPAFLGGDAPPASHADSVLLRPSPPLAVVTTVLVVAGLLGLAGRGLRRRDRELAVPALLVLGLLAAAVLVARGTAAEQVLVLTYTTWWVVPSGMLAWVVLGWGIARTAGTRLCADADADTGADADADAGERRLPAGASVGVGATACAAILALAVLSPARPEPEEPVHAEARAVGDAVAAEVRAGRTYRVDGHGVAGTQLVASTAYRIRREGGRPVVTGNDGVGAGPRYVPTGVRCTAVVTLTAAPPEPEDPATVVAEVRLPAGLVVVVVAPDAGAPSC